MNPEFLYGHTDVGRVRTNNEDAFLAETLPDGRVLACVIDGVGGYEGGEVAADIARKALLESLRSPGDAIERMEDAFHKANERILGQRLRQPELEQMACVLTCVVADLDKNQLHYAHVGDTRLYLLRDASLVKLTRDHSFVGFLEDNKRISEAEAMSHPRRNQINKAVGFDPNMGQVADYIETGASPFLPGDLLLLCSDGLTDLVDAATMTAVLTGEGDLKQKTEVLIQKANALGGKDNITVVLVANTKRARQQRATRPKEQKKSAVPPQEPQRPAPPPPAEPVKRRGSGLNWLLVVLCVALAGAAVYFYRQAHPGDPKATITGRAPVRTAAEQRLLDSLSLAPLLVVDSSFGKEILVHDTLVLRGDSLLIYGNGLVLRADTAYHGPALVTAPEVRYLRLDNLLLDGFDIGLLAPHSVVELKNVRFANCRIPVSYGLHVPEGRYVSGTLGDTVRLRYDSVLRR